MRKWTTMGFCAVILFTAALKPVVAGPEARKAAPLNIGEISVDKYSGLVYFHDLADDGKSYRVTVAISKPWDAPAVKGERIDVWLLARDGKALAVKERPRDGNLIEVGSRGATTNAVFVFERNVARSELKAVVVAVDGDPRAFKLAAPLK